MFYFKKQQLGMITDGYLNYEADRTAKKREERKTPTNPGPNPAQRVLDFISSLGIKFEEAMLDPRVVALIKAMGVKTEELKAEQAKRKQKKNLMLWGGAALLVGYLVLRKR